MDTSIAIIVTFVVYVVIWGFAIRLLSRPEFVFRCRICGFKTKDVELYRRHIEECHFEDAAKMFDKAIR